MDADVTREIEEAVRLALASGGIQGSVKLSGRTMSLHAGGAPVEIDALYLIEQWPLLPADLRGRKAADVAARLTEALRLAREGTAPAASPSARATPSLRPTGTPARGPKKPIVLPVGTILVLLCAAALVWLWLRPGTPGGSSTPVGASPGASASARAEPVEERTRRVCETARNEVLKTGTLPQLDAEVWLTELWLATSKPGSDPARSAALAQLVAQGKLTAAADPDLAALQEAKVEIVGEEPAPGVAWRAMFVRFHGAYTSAFFDAAGREKMNRVAAKLADVTGAEVGALYGRCAHLNHHDIGAWYRGATPGLAAGAIVYATGFFAERRLTNRDASSPPTSGDLVAVLTALAKVDKAKLESAVRDAGGTFAPGAGKDPTTIFFPLGGPTRAERACREIATQAGIGPDSPRP